MLEFVVASHKQLPVHDKMQFRTVKKIYIIILPNGLRTYSELTYIFKEYTCM